MHDIALSGVISALSYALDITEGQPAGHALRSCAIGMRIAEELGLSAADRSDLFYALLLKDAGCSATAQRMTELFAADEREVKRTVKLVDTTSALRRNLWTLRSVAPGRSWRERLAQARSLWAQDGAIRQVYATRCDRGAEIARMLYLSEPTAQAIRSLDEHWDGGGAPDGLAGEQIPLAARILCLAQTVEVFHADGGVRAARRVARRRRGRWFDPALVDALEPLFRDRPFWDTLERCDISAYEPADRLLTANAARLDRIAEAFARVVDAKSPFTARHSERVAEIAVGIGRRLGFHPDTLRDLRRAGLLHDVGKLAVNNLILDKPGRLTDEEFAVVRRHPVHSREILELAPCFAPIAALAANHHERLDGRGYPRGLGAEDLDLAMRVLAVADVYEALTATRPYRDALPVDVALGIMARDVPHSLDASAFGALRGLVAPAPIAAPARPAPVPVPAPHAQTAVRHPRAAHARAA